MTRYPGLFARSTYTIVRRQGPACEAEALSSVESPSTGRSQPRSIRALASIQNILVNMESTRDELCKIDLRSIYPTPDMATSQPSKQVPAHPAPLIVHPASGLH